MTSNNSSSDVFSFVDMPIESMTLEYLITHGYECLASSSDSAKLDAQLLLSLVIDKEQSYLLTWPEKTIEAILVKQYLNLLARRQKGEPIAYITGVKEFWSLPLKVSPATLIPRPDTEILVEQVLEKFQHHQNINCLDLGTGTGAIALALCSENPSWDIEGIDYSNEAITLAQLNAKNLELSQVTFYQSDWFSAVDNNKKYQLIVSNPPYIDSEDKNLSLGDVRFEPNSALVADQNGLADIKFIAKSARSYLMAQGMLFFEHGFDQGSAVRNLMADLGYTQVQTMTDLSGHERVTWGAFNSDSQTLNT